MRRKLVITSTILCMVFSLCMLAYGVYAHLNQSFSVSNTIGFVASDAIYVKLDCSVSGCEQMDLTEPPNGYSSIEDYRKTKGFTNIVDFDESMRGSEQTLDKWVIKESLVFKKFEEPLVYKIVIYNYSAVAITARISDYVTAKTNFVNTISNEVTIPGYKFDNNPSYAVLTMETRIANAAKEFSHVSNNFNITFQS